MQYGSIEPIFRTKKTRSRRTYPTIRFIDYLHLLFLIPIAFIIIGFKFIAIILFIIMIAWKVIWF
jgi:hypothetical protein